MIWRICKNSVMGTNSPIFDLDDTKDIELYVLIQVCMHPCLGAQDQFPTRYCCQFLLLGYPWPLYFVSS